MHRLSKDQGSHQHRMMPSSSISHLLLAVATVTSLVTEVYFYLILAILSCKILQKFKFHRRKNDVQVYFSISFSTVYRFL